MTWEITEKWFHVKLTNEFGQLADGTSTDSFEEALFRAKVEASTIAPPVYRTSSPPAPRARPTIADL
jgi:hypothetical protein